MQLVTVGELEIHLGVTFTGGEAARATQLINSTSADIQQYCNRVGLVRLVDDEVTLRGTYGMELALPLGPVVSVATVALGGTALTVDDYDVVKDDLVRWGGWGGPSTEVDVTYTHGLAAVPDDVKGVCLDVLARRWTNSPGVRSESIDGYSVTYAGSARAGSGLWPGDESALRSYHRSSGSVIRS